MCFFNKMNLIIGPLYSSPVKLVSQYCLENKIFMINPLSSNNEIIDNNKYAMLFLPSNKTLAIKAAEYAKEKFKKNKNAIIFYENNKVDSLIASIYQNKMEENGFNFIYKHKYNIKTYKEIKSNNGKKSYYNWDHRTRWKLSCRITFRKRL